ncbi:hypothetical protein [Nitrospira sp. M1]
MTLELSISERLSLDTPVDIQSMANKVRRYRKDDVVSLGLDLVWADLCKDSEMRGFAEGQRIVMRAYGPKIILLGLSAANNHRTITINSVQFHNLCHDYLGLPETVNYPEFINAEAQEIHKTLEQQGWLDQRYLNLDILKRCCLDIFVSRSIGSQSKGYKSNMSEIYTDYGLLERLDERSSGDVAIISEKTFGLNLLQLYRASFFLYAMANASRNKGRIDFEDFRAEAALLNTLQISEEQIKALAKQLSFPEENLRCDWFNPLKDFHPMHQKYHPDPLSAKPLICLRGSNKKQFILPSPRSFTRSLRSAIYGSILQCSQFSVLGDVIEVHIQNALENIFGSDSVSKIEHEGKKADIFLQLKKINLIIETKTAIASVEARSIMRPEDINNIWERFYNASVQCSESIKKLATPAKINIPVILVADHITAEAMPFLLFAHRSGLLKDLGIEGIQYLSWNALENTLSGISIEQFEKTLIDNYEKLAHAEVADLLTLNFEASEPAHNYEHLAEYKKRLLISKDNGCS